MHLHMVFHCQRAGLGNQELVDCNVLAALLAASALFDAAEGSLGSRIVARVLSRLVAIPLVLCSGQSRLKLTSPTMPASSFSKSLHSRSTFLEKT